MPRKREIKIELNAKEEALVHYEMEWGRNRSIRKQAKILYYANQGAASMKELCERTGCDPKTNNRMLKLYETMGVNAIYQCKRGKRINHLDQISDELEAYFHENPPSSSTEAVRIIREKFHIQISATPVKNWLLKKGIRTKSQEAFLQKQI